MKGLARGAWGFFDLRGWGRAKHQGARGLLGADASSNALGEPATVGAAVRSELNRVGRVNPSQETEVRSNGDSAQRVYTRLRNGLTQRASAAQHPTRGGLENASLLTQVRSWHELCSGS